MSILKIITNPNQSLRLKSKPVNLSLLKTAEFKDLIEDMSDTMVTKDGVGLAAPQVGHNIRLIVVHTKDGVMPMINPIISNKSLLKDWEEEGCLSVPNTFGEVKRHKKIRCKFLTPEGEAKRIEARGFLARVIQHEVDHLDGILFIDKAKDIHEAHEL
jgi:peptide deformylase